LSINKKLLVFFILLMIAATYIFNTFLDLSRLFSCTLYDSFPNEILKRINVLLAAILIWATGEDCLGARDKLLMKLVFFVISIGELFFLLGRPDLAIPLFAVCQCLLIARHGKNLGSKLHKAPLNKKTQLGFWALILFIAYLSTVAALSSYIAYNTLVILGGLYGIILSISLWTGLACSILELFPLPNSKLIAMGMLCFYACDILVGLDGLLGYSTAWIVASSLIWFFYTPAITLLALSSYKYGIKPIPLANYD